MSELLNKFKYIYRRYRLMYPPKSDYQAVFSAGRGVEVILKNLCGVYYTGTTLTYDTFDIGYISIKCLDDFDQVTLVLVTSDEYIALL